MQEKKIELNFTSAHLSELDNKDQELIANAKEAFITAYAPNNYWRRSFLKR